MEKTPVLARVLTISKDGMVSPRQDWRSFKMLELQNTTPMLSWAAYETECKKLNFKPSALEWAELHFNQNDEGPAAS